MQNLWAPKSSPETSNKHLIQNDHPITFKHTKHRKRGSTY